MNKKAFLSIETILWVAFAILILMTLYSVQTFYSNKSLSETAKQDIVISYTNLLIELKRDSLTAAYAEISANTLKLFGNQTNLICSYSLKDSILYRISSSTSSLLYNVASATFSTNEDIPNLLTVCIFPKNESDIPFITSFALRGINNDLY